MPGSDSFGCAKRARTQPPKPMRPGMTSMRAPMMLEVTLPLVTVPLKSPPAAEAGRTAYDAEYLLITAIKR